MNTFRFSVVLLLLCVATLSVAGVAQHAFQPSKNMKSFMTCFILLEHEALPEQGLRVASDLRPAELVRRGKAIVKRGVP